MTAAARRKEEAVLANIGVIGTGNIGSYHIDRLCRQIAGARVTAVYDVDSDRARAVAGSVGAIARQTPEDLIHDEGVDAVVVASPGDTHAAFVLACIRAGKPVLSEKPLATTVHDCLEVMGAEESHGSRLVQVGFMRRYDPGFGRLKAAIVEGAIGEPLLLHCIHRNATAADTFTSDMSATDSVIHEVDTARWLLGEELVAVTVLTPRRSPLAAPHLQDPQLMIMESSGGVLVEVESFVNAQYGYDVRCEVVGSEGTVELETPTTASLTRDQTRGRAVPADWKERFGRAFHSELQQWVDGVAEGRTGGPSAWDGYAATAVAVSCVHALDTGRRSPVSLVDQPSFYR